MDEKRFSVAFACAEVTEGGISTTGTAIQSMIWTAHGPVHGPTHGRPCIYLPGIILQSAWKVCLKKNIEKRRYLDEGYAVSCPRWLAPNVTDERCCVVDAEAYATVRRDTVMPVPL